MEHWEFREEVEQPSCCHAMEGQGHWKNFHCMPYHGKQEEWWWVFWIWSNLGMTFIFIVLLNSKIPWFPAQHIPEFIFGDTSKSVCHWVGSWNPQNVGHPQEMFHIPTNDDPIWKYGMIPAEQPVTSCPCHPHEPIRCCHSSCSKCEKVC